jgi:signal transduction histidine kinase
VSEIQNDIFSARRPHILLDIAELAPLEEVAERLARAALELTGAQYGAIGVYGPDSQLDHFVTVGISDEHREAIGEPPTGIGLLGDFARAGVAINLGDMSEHRSAVSLPRKHPPMGPFLGVPVVSGEQVLGAFYVCGRPGDPPFSAEDQRQLTDLAPYAAIAMSNAATLDRERARADSASVVATAANSIQGATSDDELCSALLVALRQLAPGAEVFVRLDDQPPCESGDLDDSGPFESLEDVPRLLGPTRRITEDERVIYVADGGVDLLVRIAVALDRTVPAGLDDAMRRLCDLGSAGISASLQRKAEASLERYAIRDAIARDLHDDLIQSIYAIGLGLREPTDDPVAMRATLVRATEGLNEVIRDLRSYIAQLSSGPDTLGGAARLKLRIEALLDGAAPPPEWQRTIDLGDDALEPSFERQLYLIVREAVSNVHRHAQATSASVSMMRRGNTLYLDVKDDGRGYDRQAVSTNAVGLRSIEERVTDLGGSVVMESAESRGTAVRATFPIGAEDER